MKMDKEEPQPEMVDKSDKAALLPRRQPILRGLVCATLFLTAISALACAFVLSGFPWGKDHHPKLLVREIDRCELDMMPTCGDASAASSAAVTSKASPPPSASQHPPPSALSPPVVSPPVVSPPVVSPPVVSPPSPTPVCVVVDDEDPSPAFESNAIRAAPGAKPYFEGWHGETSAKSFVHDAHGSKGALRAIYRPVLPAAGCYAVQEWHPSGGFYCLKYMPVAAPLSVRHAAGTDVLHVDQHVNGERWNLVGTFDFAAGAAELVLSNNGTTGCEYGQAAFGDAQMCYWTADALRLVRVAASCAGANGSSSVVTTEAALDASCDAAAPASDETAVARWVGVGGDRSLEMRLASAAAAHVSHGRCKLAWSARGFGASARLLVQLVHGEQPLFQLGVLTVLGTAGGDANATETTSAFALPDLHQLLEHCSSCTAHSGEYQVRLVEEVAACADGRPCELPVVSRPIHIGW